MAANALWYGDNLGVLREHVATESVDLVYLDSPFNSNRSYNVLFGQSHGADASAQIEAFADTWTWTQEADALYRTMIAGGAPGKVADAIAAMHRLLGENDVMAYLVMMAARLVELHRVLRPTGSIYLHCDPTASHYLKVLMDAIFGAPNFRTEIIWQRSSAHSDSRQGRRQHGRVHDCILFYTRGQTWTWRGVHTGYDAAYEASKYPYRDDGSGRRYGLWDMTGPGGAAKGNPRYEVMGVTRHWRYSRQRMDALVAEGRVIQPRPGAVPRFKRYLDESPGVPIQDVWTDIPAINSQAAERLGYPTQKPQALLERIIAASSNEGDVVLDPFCGCGTAMAAAQALGRPWIGIDITYIAIDLVRTRLDNTYPGQLDYEIHGIPRDEAGARALFAESPFDFERWAVSLVSGQPNEKQVGDRGIDGVIRFPLDARNATERALVSVKGGATVNPAMVRDLRGTVERDGAAIGVLVTLTTPTRGMLEEANRSGSYTWPVNGQTFPRIQLATVAQLLRNEVPAMPPVLPPYLKAARHAVPLDQLSMEG